MSFSTLRSLSRGFSKASATKCAQFTMLRAMSTTATKPKTAVVMMNMGGPATPEETGPFLQRLFGDGEIIQLGPLQNVLGPLIAKRRTPAITEQYKQIGGSPIKKWTEIQAKGMIEHLDKIAPESAPHKAYTMFRYANPLTEETLNQMKEDGVERAIAFSQYPQFSCTTTGSSLNHLWRELDRLGMESDFKWSVIDRWPLHKTFIDAVAQRVRMGLAEVPEHVREKAIILFSAHSLPMKVVNRGDPYAQEVCATTSAVMNRLRETDGIKNPYIQTWQSQVGPLPWLGPKTGEVLEGLGRQKHPAVLAVPIAFLQDHVETLFEIDIEYKEEAHEAGIEHFYRSPSLNDEPLISQAQAEIVAEHLEKDELCTTQYPLNCAGCVNPTCRSMRNPIHDYETYRAKNGFSFAQQQ